MKENIKAAWVDELRSGNWKQGSMVLTNVTDGENCCLGVLCEMAIAEGIDIPVTERGHWLQRDDTEVRIEMRAYGEMGNAYYLPKEVADWAGLEGDETHGIFVPGDPVTGDKGVNVATMNDEGKSFEDIAQAIETYA